jgi:hypothetical protein
MFFLQTLVFLNICGYHSSFLVATLKKYNPFIAGQWAERLVKKQFDTPLFA